MARLPPPPPAREITPRSLYLGRRAFLRLSAVGMAGMGLLAGPGCPAPTAAQGKGRKLPLAERHDLAGGEKQTPLEDVTHYNNFYELGTGKEEPAQRAGSLRLRPWTLAFEGEIKRPQVVDVD